MLSATTRTGVTVIKFLGCGLAVLATACASSAGTGSLIGAGVGAALGQAIGQDTEGTLIGAGVGAAAGYMIGNEVDKADDRQDQEDEEYPPDNTWPPCRALMAYRPWPPMSPSEASF